jgi:hypothetical protein
MTSIRLGARIGDVGDRVEHQGLEVSLGDGVSVVLGDKDRRSAAVKVRREVVCEIVTQDRDLFAHGESVDWTIVFTHESDTGACAKDRVTIRCGDYELPTCVLQHTTLPDEWTLYLRAWGARVELSRLEVAFDEDRTASADEVERLFLGR